MKRSEWVTMENFKLMYLHMYQELVNAGAVVKVEDKEYLDINGNVVGKFDNTNLGNNTRFRMLQPRHLLSVDKVGSNTNT